MKKSIASIILILFIAGYGFSQNLSPTVIPVQGGFDQTDHITLEWTLGETFVETISHDSHIYTQGFHQPILKVELQQKYKSIESNMEISIAPNPVMGTLNIYVSNNDADMKISLFDIKGNITRHTTVTDKENKISFDLSDLPPSTYFLQISNKNGSMLETHKIIKN